MKISIPKDQIHDLPQVEFDGEITVVDRPEMVGPAVAQLMQEEMVGFDTETRPSFTRGRAHKVALMQVSTSSHCFLFRLNKIGMPAELKAFLESPDIKKIGLSLKDDFVVMHRSCEFEPQGFIDLQDLVGNYCIADASLQRIYAIVFDMRISKGQRLTNWEATTLSPGQRQYAAIDAWACLRLYRYFMDGLFIPEQSKYIVAEPEEPQG